MRQREYRVITDVYGRDTSGLGDMLLDLGEMPKNYVLDQITVETAESIPEKLDGSRHRGNFVARVTAICRPIAEIVMSVTADASGAEAAISAIQDRIERLRMSDAPPGSSEDGTQSTIKAEVQAAERARQEAEKAKLSEAERLRVSQIRFQVERIAEEIRDRDAHPYIWPTNRNALCDAVGEDVEQARLIIPEQMGRDIPKYREALLNAAVLIVNELATVAERERAPFQGVPFS